MTLTFECPNCHVSQRVEYTGVKLAQTCADCSTELPLRGEASTGDVVQFCPVCGTKDMYVQKDFPHRLGLSIVLVGILVSTIAWWRYLYLFALAVLLITAFLDLCLYYVIGNVLVCYRCLAQVRGSRRNPAHEPFDLGIGERYRQERMRLEQIRRAPTHSAPDSNP